ncbi:MAG: TM2 domain-containing protein [Chitinophagaceae bacterium]|nr:TM2 domain-containing protein [Chitinophagaceae bacterium]
MTPKEYKRLTGHKLGLFKSIALKSAQKKANKAIANGANKSQLVALLLVAFVGVLGIHRFYLGYPVIGIVQLLTFGGFGIWALIDLIMIITGDLKPKDGSEYNPAL